MPYTKNYYAILSLPPPQPSSPAVSPAELRRAYKLALLGAHPDKATDTQQGTHTVDDVKEAYATLSDATQASQYHEWILRNPGAAVASTAQQANNGVSSDFVLGLELLDLSDFDVLDPGFEFECDGEGEGEGNVGGGERQMEWTRACRCGDTKGFRILEEELVEVQDEGLDGGEVLVGCGGCSLWVRVGFGVEG
jgi:diphthamide biosynthesis protein 4